MTIAVTPEMEALIRKCATHCGLDVSGVIRRTAAWARRNRNSIRCNISDNNECYTCNNGERVKRYTRTLRGRGVDMPDGITADDMRRALAKRCAEALARPDAKTVRINFLCMNGDGLTPQATEAEDGRRMDKATQEDT